MRLKIFFIATIIVTALFSCSRQGHKAYSPSLLVLEDSLDANPQEALNQILDIDTSSLSKQARQHTIPFPADKIQATYTKRAGCFSKQSGFGHLLFQGK